MQQTKSTYTAAECRVLLDRTKGSGTLTL